MDQSIHKQLEDKLKDNEMFKKFNEEITNMQNVKLKH